MERGERDAFHVDVRKRRKRLLAVNVDVRKRRRRLLAFNVDVGKRIARLLAFRCRCWKEGRDAACIQCRCWKKEGGYLHSISWKLKQTTLNDDTESTAYCLYF